MSADSKFPGMTSLADRLKQATDRIERDVLLRPSVAYSSRLAERIDGIMGYIIWGVIGTSSAT